MDLELHTRFLVFFKGKKRLRRSRKKQEGERKMKKVVERKKNRTEVLPLVAMIFPISVCLSDPQSHSIHPLARNHDKEEKRRKKNEKICLKP